MTLDERLVDLLMQAEDLREQGRAVSPEELCRDCPELLPELQRLLRGTGALERLLDGSASAVFGEATVVTGREPSGAPRLRGYKILGELGRGGMGVVYDAEQEALGRRVALKVLPALAGQTPERLARFQREVRAAARLHHTNIVPVYEVGQDEGVWFYSMQYIPGRPLSDVLRALRAARRGQEATARRAAPFRASGSTLSHPPDSAGSPAPRDTAAEPPALQSDAPSLSSPDADPQRYFREVARAGQQVAEALACAHAHGVLHRDVKPGNLLLDDTGRVWVADFGLAKIENEDVTRSGALLGTLRYMAPEQVRGTADARSDVYSLGMTLYELLVLRPAFDSADHLRLLDQVAHQEPPRPRALDPRIPRDLETVVLKAINKVPARRYQSAGELADELVRFLEDRPIRARRAGYVERAARWARRRPALAGLLAGIWLVAVLGFAGVTSALVYAWAGWTEADQQRRRADGSRVAAQDAQEQEADQRRRAEANLYFSRLAQARIEWQANDAAAAERLLDGCPPESRGWEWRYLKGRNHADLLTIPEVFGELVYGVAYSPDGERLAAAGGSQFGPPGVREHGAVKVWGALTGEERLVIPTLGVATDVAFSPDGTRLAGRTQPALGKEGVVAVWDAATGREALRIPGPFRTEVALAYRPDGRRLAVADRTGQKVWVFDAATGKEAAPPLRHQDKPLAVAYSPDGAALASGGVDGVYLRSGTEAKDVRLSSDHCPSVAFAPDGRLLAAAGGSSVRLWDVAGGRRVMTLAGPSEVTRVAFSPDGRHLAAAGADGGISLWDVRTGEERMTLRGHAGRVFTLAFHPNGRYLATGGQQRGEVKVWDLTTDPDRLVVRPPRENTNFHEALGFDRDGRLLTLRGISGELEVRDVPAGTLRAEQTLPVNARQRYPARPAAFSGDGRLVACVAPGDERRVTIWEVAGGREVRTLDGLKWPLGVMAFSDDGRRLVTLGRSVEADQVRHEVLVWDTDTAARVASFELHAPPLRRRFAIVTLSPDGRLLAANDYPAGATDDEPARVKVWDLASGRELATLPAPAGVVECLAFRRDGRRLAAAGESGRVAVWDVGTGAPCYPAPLQGPQELFDLAWAPDGTRLAGVTRKELQMWDTASGQGVLLLRGAPARGWDNGFNPHVAWSPDGRFLASSNWDHSVSVWDSAVTWTPEGKAELRESAAARAFSWHLRAALDSARAGDDFARDFHDKRLGEPPTPRDRLDRGNLYAELDRWDRAAADYAAALAAEPDLRTAQVGFHHVLACLRAGDADGYRRACAALYEAWGQSDDPATMQLVVRACTCGAWAPPDADGLLRRVEAVAPLPAGRRMDVYLLAALRYRAGRYEDAAAACRDLIARPDWHSLKPQAWLYLALACHRLGRADESRKWLGTAREWFGREEAERASRGVGHYPDGGMWDWAEMRQLRAEAVAVCAGK